MNFVNFRDGSGSSSGSWDSLSTPSHSAAPKMYRFYGRVSVCVPDFDFLVGPLKLRKTVGGMAIATSTRVGSVKMRGN